jgi:hypothetical protein
MRKKVTLNELKTIIEQIIKEEMGGDLRYFKFKGFGNYSEDFDWDTGLVSDIEDEISFEEAMDVTGDVKPVIGVYDEVDAYGGSRNAYGVVVARSMQQAIKLLRDYDDTYKVVEYESRRNRNVGERKSRYDRPMQRRGRDRNDMD